MVGVRLIAAAVGVVNGVWGIVAGIYSGSIFDVHLSTSTSGGDFWILVVGALLLLTSLACFTGVRTAFYGSAALSILLVIDILLFGAGISVGLAVSAALGVVTVVLDVLAIRKREYVSEENHPLNLPVFG